MVAYEPRQGVVGALDITITALEQTTFARSFKGWKLDAATKKSTPYFVRASITNLGESSLAGRESRSTSWTATTR